MHHFIMKRKKKNRSVLMKVWIMTGVSTGICLSLVKELLNKITATTMNIS